MKTRYVVLAVAMLGMWLVAGTLIGSPEEQTTESWLCGAAAKT